MTRPRHPHRPATALVRSAALAHATALLLLAAACTTPAPEGDRLAEGGDTNPPPASTSPAPAAEPPAPAGGDLPTACTQIGCSDGLQVELDGFRDEVELELEADGESRRITCLPPGPCRHFIPDFTPAEVTATALHGDHQDERTFTPDYREVRPNGADCPPVCRQASIRWKL